MKPALLNIKNSIWIGSFFCFFSLSCFALPLPENVKNSEKKLTDIKSKISDTQSEIKQVVEQRKTLENQLKKDDLAIALVVSKINRNQQNQKKIEQNLSELSQQKKALLTEKKQQETLLAKQLRTAYSAGHHDYLKLLLNQENPSTVQRTLTHYKYINDARIKDIDQFKVTINKLVSIEKKYNEQATALENIVSELANDKLAFEQKKQSRAQTIVTLKKEQQSKEQRLNQLLSQEKTLTQAIERLAKLSKPRKNLNGLSKLKRKLSLPVAGKIRHRFGSQKHAYIKWKGILQSAKLGSSVKAIYDGTILFSDWLQGYGLVTIIDHGQGYMSLYGHNQALLKKVGEYVEQGETISLVGQSGGQSQPGLYFEIRHRGRAVNPKLWCR